MSGSPPTVAVNGSGQTVLTHTCADATVHVDTLPTPTWHFSPESAAVQSVWCELCGVHGQLTASTGWSQS